MTRKRFFNRHFWIGVIAGLVGAVVAFVLLGDDPPSRDEPASYTQYVVRQTIDRYRRDGHQATLDYVNSAESVDGQWYPYIINEDGYTVGHHNASFRYRDPSERVDSTGYFYGDELLGAGDDGVWVTYLLLNPDTGREQKKHTWVVLHDGLIFGSGWYEPAGS